MYIVCVIFIEDDIKIVFSSQWTRFHSARNDSGLYIPVSENRQLLEIRNPPLDILEAYKRFPYHPDIIFSRTLQIQYLERDLHNPINPIDKVLNWSLGCSFSQNIRQEYIKELQVGLQTVISNHILEKDKNMCVLRMIRLYFQSMSYRRFDVSAVGMQRIVKALSTELGIPPEVCRDRYIFIDPVFIATFIPPMLRS